MTKKRVKLLWDDNAWRAASCVSSTVNTTVKTLGALVIIKEILEEQWAHFFPKNMHMEL